jgi:hypothetical protein
MSEAVCCPKCWAWHELGKRTTCKQCGTPLILADGRSVTEAANPGSAPLVPAFAGNAAALPTTRVARRGVDWVDIARLVTAGYGLLVVVGLIILGFAFQHLNVPITNPNTGQTTVQTIDLGPGFAIVAIFTAGFFALFTWLTKFLVARIIFLGLDALSILSLVSHLGAAPGSVGLLGAVSLIIDLGYALVLILSLVSPRSA